MNEYIIVFAWGFVPAVAYLTYAIVLNAWKQRWSQKFKGPKPEGSDVDDELFHDSDLEAFYARLKYDVDRLRWSIIFATPFIVGTVVSIVWWLIYYSIEVIV